MNAQGWVVVVLFVLGGQAFGQGQDAGSAWTSTELERRVREELAAEGTLLSKAGLNLRVEALTGGQWRVSVEDVWGKQEVRSRTLTTLPNELDAAAAELVPVAAELVKKPAKVLEEPEAPRSSEEIRLEKKLQIAHLVSDDLKAHGGGWASGSGLGAGTACFLNVIFALDMQNTESAASSALAGCLISMAGSIELPGSTRGLGFGVYGLSRAAEQAGTGFGLLGMAYVAHNSRPLIGNSPPILSSGWHWQFAIPSYTLMLSGLATGIATWRRPSCAYDEQERLLKGVLESEEDGQEDEIQGTIRDLERCGDVREHRYPKGLLYVQLGVFAAETLALIVDTPVEASKYGLPRALAANSFPVADLLILGMDLLEDVPGGPAVRFLELVRKENLPLEVTLAPTFGGQGIAVNGRF